MMRRAFLVITFMFLIVDAFQHFIDYLIAFLCDYLDRNKINTIHYIAVVTKADKVFLCRR